MENIAYFDLDDGYYCRTYREGGIGCIDDHTIIFILKLLKKAGYERICFYDRQDSWSIPEFCQWAKSDDKLFYVLYREDGTPISIAWFNGFSETGHQAFAHFSTLKTAPPEESLRAGRSLIRLLGRITVIKQLIGITPTCYQHAVNFAIELGFKRLDILKGHVMLRGKARDSMLSIAETQGSSDGK